MAVWIVGGTMRSGTSMMMRCIGEASPLPLRYDEGPRAKWDEWHPNPNGFFEVAPAVRWLDGFPTQFDGEVVKCFLPELMRLPAFDYNIVLMERDANEIVDSARKSFGGGPVDGLKIEANREVIKGILEQRQDVKLTVLSYVDVINDPAAQFDKMVANGWPIDVPKAVSLVDPTLYRIRRGPRNTVRG